MNNEMSNEEKLKFVEVIRDNQKKLSVLTLLRWLIRLISLGIFGFGVAGFFIDIPVPRLYLFLGCTAGAIIFHLIAKGIVKSFQKKIILNASVGKLNYGQYMRMKKRGELKFLLNELVHKDKFTEEK